MIRNLLLVTLALSAMPSCSSPFKTQAVPNPDTERRLSAADWKRTRQVEIYFDGTSNDWAARTNVRRRFEVGAMAEDPARPCLYIEGVGTGVGTGSLLGKAFGAGMKPRVLKAYKFLARHWRHRDPRHESDLPEDTILIFGFSRGAFQARMLAGLMAHCGLPHLEHWHRETSRPTAEEDAALDRLAEDVWDYCEKHLLDPTELEATDGAPVWRKRLADNRAQLQDAMKKRHPNFQWGEPRIKLLALWDTVPGLSFTKLKDLGEPESGHQIYKVRPYPNIENVVHALALDDRRSKFKPLLVGPPVDRLATNVYEVWFPGAHSDVGGGYADSNDMAGTSFNWLHRIMQQRKIATRSTVVYEDSLSILHHPEESLVHRLTSDSVPRQLRAGAHIDRTVFRRADGQKHREENRAQYVLYTTKNRVVDGPGSGKIFDAAQAGKSRAEQEAYLQSLGLTFHDDRSPTEKALPEQGRLAAPLSITQMAAGWVEPSKSETPSSTP